MKTMKNFSIEVLAPVGNREMLVAAVRSGADAVYLGTENFNARRNAKNFSEADLNDGIRYCHIRGVKVYLTLNTMLRDDELESAVSVAKSAYTAGIDAVIAADLGLIRRLHLQFPDLSIHASTQMSVHSCSALPILKEMGVSRVVLSREMDKEGIRQFAFEAKKLGIETEVFVHGALCMSVSGQCLLSSVIGGRSGNRGLCAGPCRLPFSNGKNEYALSLKDLSLLDYANELRVMGVASLKIEGRMKRPEYVAAAVAAFKNALGGENCEKSAENLQNIFSRSGFTSGYYDKRLGADMFGIRTREDVLASGEVINEIHSLYRNEAQRIPLKMWTEIVSGKPSKLTVFDGINTAEVIGQIPEAAQNKPLTKENVALSLAKLGGTPYYAENIVIDIEQGLFLSGAALNELRRNCIAKLDELRGQTKPIKEKAYTPKFEEKRENKTEFFCRFQTASQVPDDLSGISLITLPLFEDFEGILLPDGVEIAVELPRGILNEEQISKKLKKTREKGVKTAFCGTLAAKELAEKEGFGVIADVGFNVYNSEAAKVLAEANVRGLIISPELKAEQLRSIKSRLLTGYFAYGRLPIMLTRNCPVNNGDCANCQKDRALTDRMGVKFPVKCVNGFAEVFNSKPHYLADKQNEFRGMDFAYLYFTLEEKEEAKNIIEAYKVGKKPSGEFTRGLYFREVH